MSPAVAMGLIRVLDLFSWAVIARVILSWVVRDPENPAVRFFRFLTAPFLDPLSRVMNVGGIDLAPMVVLFGVQAAQRALAAQL